MNKTFGYVRVSHKDQNPERQIKAIKKFYPNIRDEDIYIDEATGVHFERENYQSMKKQLRSEDTLIIQSVDRLGRNAKFIKDELLFFNKQGITIRFINVPTTLSDDIATNPIMKMVNDILIEILSVMAEEEWKVMRQRQAEGIEIAREQGKYKGRDKGTFKADMKKFKKVYNQVQGKQITVTQAVELLGYKSRTSYYNMARQHEEQ